MALLNRSSSQTADAIEGLLEQRDIVGLVTIGAGAAGGVVITQRIANRVLPLLGMNATPQTLADGVTSATVKSATGAGFMYGATQTEGLGAVLLAFLSIGSLTSAGFDLLGLFLDVPSLAQPNTSATAARASSSQRSNNANVTATVKSSPDGSATATDGGSDFGNQSVPAEGF